MTHIEFKDLFDVLYNNIMSNAAPGLNDYDISIFLTKGQDEVIKNFFNPKGNRYLEGIDDSAKRQIDFSFLISVKDAVATTVNTLNSDSKSFILPGDMLLPINESVITNTGPKLVITLTPLEYTILMSKSYRQPLKNQVYKIITSSSSNVTVEIIANSAETILSYKVKYVRRPRPIIVANIGLEYGGASIDGVSTISECELNPIVHQSILQRAVELAKAAYIGDVQTVVELGLRSE